jgi:hypothetical protein
MTGHPSCRLEKARRAFKICRDFYEKTSIGKRYSEGLVNYNILASPQGSGGNR